MRGAASGRLQAGSRSRRMPLGYMRLMVPKLCAKLLACVGVSNYVCYDSSLLPSNGREAGGPPRSDLDAAERVRAAVIMLSAESWRPPAIAQHLDYHAATVRHALKAYLARGRAGLWPQRPGLRWMPRGGRG